MKRCTVIIVITTKKSYLQISRFLEDANFSRTLFVRSKSQKIEIYNQYQSIKQHFKCSEISKASEFNQQDQHIIDYNTICSMRSSAKASHESEDKVKRIVDEDIKYKINIMRKS